MKKVLLALEDYSELVYIQTLLKKLGFDADSAQTKRSYEDTLLAFNPDVIISTGRGKKLNGIDMAEAMYRTDGWPKIILLAKKSLKEKLENIGLKNVDGLLVSPVSPRPLLQLLSKLCNLDFEALYLKYSKIKGALPESRNDDVEFFASVNAGDPGAEKVSEGGICEEEEASPSSPGFETDSFSLQSSLTPESRKLRYKEFLKSVERPPNEHFSRQKVAEFHRQIRREEKSKESKDLDQQRREFVNSLFKKD